MAEHYMDPEGWKSSPPAKRRPHRKRHAPPPTVTYEVAVLACLIAFDAAYEEMGAYAHGRRPGDSVAAAQPHFGNERTMKIVELSIARAMREAKEAEHHA